MVDCESRIQLIPSREADRIPASIRSSSVRAGPVMFVGARDRKDDESKPRRGGRLRFKVPIVVEAGAPVTVTLSAESQSNAVITVGLDRRPYEVRGPSVELQPCRPNATVANRPVGSSTPFAAGFRLNAPGCVRLEVQSAEASLPIVAELPLGAGCGTA